MGIPCSLHPLGANEKLPYDIGEVLYESRSSGADVFCKKGVYRVTLVGSGGSNSCYGACNAGGSGAAYEADIYMNEGDAFFCKVSSGNFGIDGLAYAGKGTNGSWADGGAGKGGTLTLYSDYDSRIVTVIKSTNGNSSSSRIDTVSAYDGTAYGYGASKANSGSVAGIVRIQYLRPRR